VAYHDIRTIVRIQNKKSFVTGIILSLPTQLREHFTT